MREETDQRYRLEAVAVEKDERGAHSGMHKEKSPKPLTGKTRRADFHEFLQPGRLKD